MDLKLGSYYMVNIDDHITGRRYTAVYRYCGPDSWTFDGYHARPSSVIEEVEKPDPATCLHQSVRSVFGQPICQYCGKEAVRKWTLE